MERKDETSLELNKILSACAGYATLPGARKAVTDLTPAADMVTVSERLDFTEECYTLLYVLGCGGTEPFADGVTDDVTRAAKGAVLNCREIREVSGLLKSARIAYTSVNAAADGSIKICTSLVSRLFFDARLETEIAEKVVSDDALSDRASPALFEIRQKIRQTNEKIRSRLSEYASGKDAEYLQDSTVTMRGGRYVVPVKAEHKTHVKGFIHDRSQSGATFFVEPEYVLELNNELISLEMDEKEETEKILRDLSSRIGARADALMTDITVLTELDAGYAAADYSYSIRGVRPAVNDGGVTDIICGRHPLIDRDSVVPVSFSLGKGYNFLILSGANTGGKTVTLKMCGLFPLMAACGIFIPAAAGSEVAIYDKVYCDVGDSQSIEESLSTFSSHMTNIIDICEKAGEKSLVLLDEIGGGTNPDEGQAIAKATLEYLLKRGCRGIITTHFTALKEFAYSLDGAENAGMEFDADTLKPLYRLRTGLAGASNALAISRRLGMNVEIIEAAKGYLSDGSREFVNLMESAEKSRIEAEKIKAEAEEERKKLAAEKDRYIEMNGELTREREKIRQDAKRDADRLIAEESERVREIEGEIEEIFRKEEMTQNDLVRARTLKNSLNRMPLDDGDDGPCIPADINTLEPGRRVRIAKSGLEGYVSSVAPAKGEAEVMIGEIRYRCKLKDLQMLPEGKDGGAKTKPHARDIVPSRPVLEINVIGMTVDEAIPEIDAFLDRAVTDNLEEVKIIHGVGRGILRSAVAQHLKKHRNVSSFRPGQYGEGESGVTIVKLK